MYLMDQTNSSSSTDVSKNYLIQLIFILILLWLFLLFMIVIPLQVLSWCRSCSSCRISWESSARQTGWSSTCHDISGGHWRRHQAWCRYFQSPAIYQQRWKKKEKCWENWLTEFIRNDSGKSKEKQKITMHLDVMEVDTIHGQFLRVLKEIHLCLCWSHSPLWRMRVTQVNRIIITSVKRQPANKLCLKPWVHNFCQSNC